MLEELVNKLEKDIYCELSKEEIKLLYGIDCKFDNRFKYCLSYRNIYEDLAQIFDEKLIVKTQKDINKNTVVCLSNVCIKEVLPTYNLKYIFGDLTYFMSDFRNLENLEVIYGNLEFLELNSFDGLDKNYITISNDRGILKPINLSHECDHGVLNIYNPNLLYNVKDDFSSEIGSIFFELAFNYDIGKNFDSYDSALNNIQELSDKFDIVNSLMMHRVLINIWEKNNYKVDNNFYKIAKYEYNLTKYMVDEALNISITGEGIYAIGFMIALYLLKIYKQDKKSSIELLKDITNYNNYDSYEMINVLMPNINSFSNEIDDINNTYDSELKKIYKK